jgi:uncharacterized protein DUF3298
MYKKLYLIIVLFLLTLSCATAADMADIDKSLEDSLTFHVYDDVDLVSTLKFEYGKPRIIIKSVYPQLASETMREGVDAFNAISLQTVKDEITRYRSLIKEYAPLQSKMNKKTIVNNLYIDYNTSYIKPARDHIISVRFSVQGYVGGKKQPYRDFLALNYNLDKNQRIELADLFIPNVNYLDVISQYVYGVLQKRFGNNMKSSGAAPRVENYATFNLKPNGLLITFDEDAVAPRVFGAQTILVPYSALTQIIAPDSPIAVCIDHPQKCKRHNLLTGGFIDEAVNTRHGRFNPVLGQL